MLKMLERLDVPGVKLCNSIDQRKKELDLAGKTARHSCLINSQNKDVVSIIISNLKRLF
jgi:hypothetical protein